LWTAGLQQHISGYTLNHFAKTHQFISARAQEGKEWNDLRSDLRRWREDGKQPQPKSMKAGANRRIIDLIRRGWGWIASDRNEPDLISVVSS